MATRKIFGAENISCKCCTFISIKIKPLRLVRFKNFKTGHVMDLPPLVENRGGPIVFDVNARGSAVTSYALKVNARDCAYLLLNIKRLD